MSFIFAILLSTSSVTFADQICPDIYRCTAYENNAALQADGASLQDAQDETMALFEEAGGTQAGKLVCVRIERYFAWAGCFEK